MADASGRGWVVSCKRGSGGSAICSPASRRVWPIRFVVAIVLAMPVAIATESLFLTVSDDRAVLGRRGRADTPHLTLLWGTRSGELELHLK